MVPFTALSRLKLVSTNDVAVSWSRDGTLSDEGASVKLKHQNHNRNYLMVPFTAKSHLPQVKRSLSSG